VHTHKTRHRIMYLFFAGTALVPYTPVATPEDGGPVGDFAQIDRINRTGNSNGHFRCIHELCLLRIALGIMVNSGAR
jgi:hypothetical protein